MCTGFYLDEYDLPCCELLEDANYLLTMRECSLSLFAWYQAHRSYCEALFGERTIRADEVCWQLDMLPRLRNIVLQMIHAQAWQINASKYRPQNYEDIPF